MGQAPRDATDGEPVPPDLPGAVDLARPTWWDAPEAGGEQALMRAIASSGPARSSTAPSGAGLASGRHGHAIRWAVAAAVGIAAAVALLAVGYQWGDRPAPTRGAEFALAATGVQSDAAARGRIDVTANGTWIRLEVGTLAPARPGEYYEAWLTDGARHVSAGTFHMRGAPAPVVLWAGVSPEDYPELVVTVQSEGRATPSEAVVLRGFVGS